MISQMPRLGPLPRLGVCFIIAPDNFAGAHAARTPLFFRYAGYKLTGSLRIARQFVACFAHRYGR